MFLPNKPHSFIGLDISDSSIRIVELLNRGKRIDLSAYAYVNLPEPYVIPSALETMNVKDWAQLINDSLNAGQFSSDLVVASLPSSTVFTTTIIQPNIPDNELDKAIKFSASRVVPADLNEMIVVWSKEGKTNPSIPLDDTTDKTSPKPKPNKNKDFQEQSSIPVFIAAIPKNVITWYKDLVAELNMELFSLELSSFSLRRLIQNSSHSSILICDIDALETTFHIIDRGAVKIVYLLDYGYLNCIASLINTAGLPSPIAKNFIIGEPDSHRAAATPPASINLTFEPIVEEAKKICEKFEQSKNRPISQTVLTGEGSLAHNLRSLWAQKMNHQTTLANPWRGLSLSPELDNQLKNKGPVFTRAVCLAQRHLTM